MGCFAVNASGPEADEVLATADRSQAERHRVLGGFRMHTAFMGINAAIVVAGLTYSAFAIVG
jgi:hypothetical protein